MARARRPVIAGNWKMHHTRRDVVAFVATLAPALPRARADILLFPSFPLLPVLQGELQRLAVDSLDFGGQDLHPEDSGAHTGDVSGVQLRDTGCTWVLCGHSERRAEHAEDDALVAAKARTAVRSGLRPLPCIGETQEQRAAGATWSVLERQLASVVDVLRHADSSAALAYEPVWAIGSGQAATPATARETHTFLRSLLVDHLGREQGEAIRILYGGSVIPDNAAALFTERDIDGFLIGGASLDPARFLDIITVCGL